MNVVAVVVLAIGVWIGKCNFTTCYYMKRLPEAAFVLNGAETDVMCRHRHCHCHRHHRPLRLDM